MIGNTLFLGIATNTNFNPRLLCHSSDQVLSYSEEILVEFKLASDVYMAQKKKCEIFIYHMQE